MSEFVIDFQRLAMWPVVLLAAAVLLVVWWTYRRTTPPLPLGYKILLCGIRSLVVVLIGLLVLEPLLALGGERSRDERVALLVDRSASMLLPHDGSDEGLSRLEMATEMVEQLAAGQDTSAEKIKIFAFGRIFTGLDSINDLVPELLEDRTDLAGALEELLGDPGPGWDRVVVISDGRVNAGGSPLAVLPDSGLRVDAVLVGGGQDGVDLALSGIEQSSPAYEDGEVELELTLAGQAGAAAGESVTVDIFLDGRKVAERRLEAPSGGASMSAGRVSFAAPEAGSYWLEATLRTSAGELSELNNSRLHRLHVRKSRRTFMLISNSPDWDLTFAGRALASVQDWEVHTLLVLQGESGSIIRRRVSAGAFTAGSLPGKAELENAALVLLHGNIAKLGRGFLDRLAVRAASGALALVLWPTTSFNPSLLPKELAPLLPISRGAITPVDAPATASRLITNGRYGVLDALGGGGIIDGLPPVTTVYRGLKLARSAEILARAGSRGPLAGQGEPVLAVRPSAGVRSALIAAQGLWRWHMQRQLGDPADAALYYGMWRELAGWLTGAEKRSPLVLEPEREVFGRGAPVVLSGEIRDGLESGELTVEASLWRADSAGTRDTVATVRKVVSQQERTAFALEFGVQPPGFLFYGALASAGANTLSAGGELAVESYSPELAELPADSTLLAALVSSTGGRMVRAGNQVGRLEAVGGITERFSRRIALRGADWLYWLIVALLAAEWVLRRRKALP